MSATILAPADRTYTEAVRNGDYDLYLGNLFGKYDNVRIYWEDQLTRMAIRPYLSELMSRKRQQREKVRIIDLGCGSGQGFQVLTKIDRRNLDLSLYHDRVIPEEAVEVYLGLDLSQAMVDKGNEIFAQKPQVRFIQSDLRDGLGAAKEQEAAFDIYFSSYASFSHLNRAELKRLLVDIHEHGRDGSLVVLDLIGRNSVEWPDYWFAETEEEKVRDYSMSYLHTEFGYDQEVEHFPLRFWTGPEVDELAGELSRQYGAHFEVLDKFDRSILVGRHVDTQEYNPHIKPIRRIVNCLHEDYMRTDLTELVLEPDMFPQHPDAKVARFQQELISNWNLLVTFCQERLVRNTSLVDLEGWSEFSPPLQFALMTMDRVINDTEWMWYGDPRANIIEPQLGYTLRSLEHSHQKGMGCGHGLVAVLQLTKKAAA